MLLCNNNKRVVDNLQQYLKRNIKTLCPQYFQYNAFCNLKLETVWNGSWTVQVTFPVSSLTKSAAISFSLVILVCRFTNSNLCVYIYISIFVYLPHHGFNMFQHHLFNFHEWFIRFHDLFETSNLHREHFIQIYLKVYNYPYLRHAMPQVPSTLSWEEFYNLLQVCWSYQDLSMLNDTTHVCIILAMLWQCFVQHRPASSFARTTVAMSTCFSWMVDPWSATIASYQGPRQKNDLFRHLSYTVNLHAVSVCISMCLCSPSEMSENQPSQVVVPRDVTDREQLGHAPKRYREGTACACTVSSQRSQSPISPHGSSTFGNFKNFEETLPKMLAMEETSSVLNPWIFAETGVAAVQMQASLPQRGWNLPRWNSSELPTNLSFAGPESSSRG